VGRLDCIQSLSSTSCCLSFLTAIVFNCFDVPFHLAVKRIIFGRVSLVCFFCLGGRYMCLLVPAYKKTWCELFFGTKILNIASWVHFLVFCVLVQCHGASSQHKCTTQESCLFARSSSTHCLLALSLMFFFWGQRNASSTQHKKTLHGSCFIATAAVSTLPFGHVFTFFTWGELLTNDLMVMNKLWMHISCISFGYILSVFVLRRIVAIILPE